MKLNPLYAVIIRCEYTVNAITIWILRIAILKTISDYKNKSLLATNRQNRKQTAKQSVFLRIQVRASSETKGLERS